MLRKFLVVVSLSLVWAATAWAQEAQPTAPPKCSAVPPKNFPAAPPAAQMKLGRCLLHPGKGVQRDVGQGYSGARNQLLRHQPLRHLPLGDLRQADAHLHAGVPPQGVEGHQADQLHLATE